MYWDAYPKTLTLSCQALADPYNLGTSWTRSMLSVSIQKTVARYKPLPKGWGFFVCGLVHKHCSIHLDFGKSLFLDF